MKQQEYTLTIQLFAGAASAVGTRAVDVVMPVHATVADLVKQLEKQYPALTALLPHSRWAVGEAFVELEHVFEFPQRQVIAMIPPVSGG